MQSEILARAAARVRPGGRLVYSTCALLPEENRENIEQFLEDRADFTFDDDRTTFPAGGFSDGGYLARMKRNEDA